jgi:hypothetical protein
MNFPEVPFDENLFASNTMLKSYWERSTNERPDAIIPDWPSEESAFKESDDAKELRAATASQWDDELKPDTEPEVEQIEEPVLEIPEINIEKKQSLDIVKPKMSGTSIALIIVGSIAAALFFAYLLMASRKSYRRV